MTAIILLSMALATPASPSPSHQAIQELICTNHKDDAQKLSLKLASAGDPDGFIGLGWLEENANPAALTPAFAYYLTAAELGSAKAQWKVGVMLDTGAGIPADSKAAARWLQKATKQDLGAAWSSFGLLQQFGRGTKMSRSGAKSAYLRAIKLGEPHGFAGIGALYSSHSEKRKDYLQAIAWYRVAVSYGDDIARGKLDALPPLSSDEEVWVAARTAVIKQKHPMVVAWNDDDCPPK